jgi:ribose transport system substrate-binding protein
MGATDGPPHCPAATRRASGGNVRGHLRLRLGLTLVAMATLAVAAGACGGSSSDNAAGGGSTTADTTAQTVSGEYGETLKNGTYGENYNAPAAAIDQALLGKDGLPTDPMARNIVLAALTRSATKVDEAKALECWKKNSCETGTGGKLTVGLADGFGGNVARQMFKMEFIMQALTYKDIGKIVYTDANLDAQKAISDMRSMIAQGVNVIVSYPDAGKALLPVYRQATQRGTPVSLWAGANLGKPGTDYMTYTGRNYCAIGKAYAKIMNENLPDGGQIALLGGTPGNTTSPQWQKCEKADLNPNVKVVATADTNWTRQGALQAMSGILAKYPDLKGVSYDYGDAFVGAMRAFQATGKKLDLVATVETDENSLFCAWKKAADPNFKLWTFVAAASEARMDLTAGMMKRQGAPVPSGIVTQAALKRVDENSCRPDLAAAAPPSALVPHDLQEQMFK